MGEVQLTPCSKKIQLVPIVTFTKAATLNNINIF